MLTLSPPSKPIIKAPIAGPIKLMIPSATLSQEPMAVARLSLVRELPHTTLQQSPVSVVPSHHTIMPKTPRNPVHETPNKR
jgi:hypothetical protein